MRHQQRLLLRQHAYPDFPSFAAVPPIINLCQDGSLKVVSGFSKRFLHNAAHGIVPDFAETSPAGFALSNLLK
jgi:hypothetical protein